MISSSTGERGSHTSVFAVLTAAGSGSRLGHTLPKALVPVGGVPMFCRATAGLISAGVHAIVITAPADECDHFRELIAQGECGNLTHPHTGHPVPIAVVAGGNSRQASVSNGLSHVGKLAEEHNLDIEEGSVILIHDAARALTPPEVIERVIDAVRAGSTAVIPALPVTDTLKAIDRHDPATHAIGRVSATVDRNGLVAVQTPQGFTLGLIQRAHADAHHLAHAEELAATDDAGLVEMAGGTVAIVSGDPRALKITTSWDLGIAEYILASEN